MVVIPTITLTMVIVRDTPMVVAIIIMDMVHPIIHMVTAPLITIITAIVNITQANNIFEPYGLHI